MKNLYTRILPRPEDRSPCHEGSALIVTVMALAVLFIVAGTLLSITTSKQAAPFQAASWHEAGSAAEGGVELALNALRRSVSEGDAAAWNGWTATAGPTFATKYLTEGDLSHEGEGNKTVRAIVEVSIPTGAGTINPTSVPGEQRAYLIRSTGLAQVPGPVRLSQESANVALRKLNFFTDFRTKAAVAKPQVTRVIEAIAVPVTPFPLAIHAKEQLEITKGKAMVVDSYNSTIAPYSSTVFGSVGAFRRKYGNIASNGKTKDIIRLENVAVYGDAAKGTGGLVEMKANASVSGQIIDGFYQEMSAVQSPRSRPTFLANIQPNTGSGGSLPSTLTTKSGDTTIKAGQNGGTRYYKFDGIHIHDKKLKIEKFDGSASSVGGTAEIWVPGDIVIHKGSFIEVENGANAIFYYEKNLTLEEKDKSKSEGAIRNANVRAIPNGTTVTATDGSGTIVTLPNGSTAPNPASLQFYGVQPPTPTKKNKYTKVKIRTSAVAAFHSPDSEFEINLKQDRHIYGALSGRKFKIKAETQIHYDESLGVSGKPFDYTLASWQEDWFDPKARPTN